MPRKREEIFLRDIKKTKREFKLNFRINLEDQRWLYYAIIGSFFILVILNGIFPKTPVKTTQFEVKSGLLGVGLVFFGAMFLLNALFTGEGFTWLLGAIICVILLYFGLPLFFGFQW